MSVLDTAILGVANRAVPDFFDDNWVLLDVWKPSPPLFY